MTSRCTEHHRRIPGDDTGTATTEAALVMLVLLFFLLLAPAIWRIWISDAEARTEAHRLSLYKATHPLVFPHAGIELPDHLGGHQAPAPPPMPDVAVGEDLEGYTEFANEHVEGWERRIVQYSSGWSGFRGELVITRYAVMPRAPWTWLGYPAVPTQDLLYEHEPIREWFERAYKNTLDDDMVDGLKLDRSPIGD